MNAERRAALLRRISPCPPVEYLPDTRDATGQTIEVIVRHKPWTGPIRIRNNRRRYGWTIRDVWLDGRWQAVHMTKRIQHGVPR